MSSYSSFSEDKKRFDDWRKFLLKEIQLDPEGTKEKEIRQSKEPSVLPTLPQAIANIKKGDYQKGDYNTKVIKKVLNNLSADMTVGQLKTLLELMKFKESEIEQVVKDLGSNYIIDAIGLATGLPFLGTLVTVITKLKNHITKNNINQEDQLSVLQSLFILPDDMELPNVVKALDLDDSYTKNINKEVFELFSQLMLKILNKKIKHGKEDSKVDPTLSNMEMWRALSRRGLKTDPPK
jgi:hypothetical protein